MLLTYVQAIMFASRNMKQNSNPQRSTEQLGKRTHHNEKPTTWDGDKERSAVRTRLLRSIVLVSQTDIDLVYIHVNCIFVYINTYIHTCLETAVGGRQ